MKAIRVHRVGDPSVMQLEGAPDPEAGPGQVLVQIRAAGLPLEDAARAHEAVSAPGARGEIVPTP